MKEELDDFMLVYKYDSLMEHSKWIKEIPYIQFPSNWQVQISPPSTGAVVRFRVKKDLAEVSIYLDCYDRLGIYGTPYWEVYPYNDDVFRCDMHSTNELIEAIAQSIEEQNN